MSTAEPVPLHSVQSGTMSSHLAAPAAVPAAVPDTDQVTLEPEDEASQEGPLTAFDIFSLVINKMIGTGIYNSPGAVLLMTGSKGVTLGLWAIGFVYTLVR